MNFYISHIFWLVFPPLNVIVLLLLAGYLLKKRKPSLARWANVVGVGLFVLCAVLPTGRLLLQQLEAAYPAPSAFPARINGILVLGGAFDVEVTMARHVPTLYDSADRVTETMRLMHFYPKATVIYSGGNGTLDPSIISEAEVFKAFLSGQGIPDDSVKYEMQSRNTYENILDSRLIAQPTQDSVWILVTSAAHMKRAMALMTEQNWPGTIIPDPIDYQTTGTTDDFMPSADLLGNLAATHLAVREYLALLIYQLSGKIDLSDLKHS
jgi:uncharacterized SAM-binding protein YcdF (DUF218 family)